MEHNGMKGMVVLGCGIVLCILPACSTMKNVVGFFKFWDNRTEAAVEESYKSFASSVKPVLRGNPESHNNLARFYQDRGKHREAIEELRKAVAIDPSNVKAFNAMGVSYDYLGSYAKASECYQVAIKLDPSASYVYNNMGQSLILQQNHAEAIEAFKKALAADSTNVRIHNNLAKAYALAGLPELAVKEFEQGAPKISAKAMVEEVLKEAARPVDSTEQVKAAEMSVPGVATADKGTAEFVARISGFLQERPSSKVTHEQKESIGTVAAEPNKIPNSMSNVLIEVSNGNGINQMATNIADNLRKKGFRVARITNARSFSIPRTCIYYQKDHADTANELARYVQTIEENNIKEVHRLDVPQINVKLVIGKDMALYQKAYSGTRS